MNSEPTNNVLCRVVVLISGSGSNLQALIDSQNQGTSPIEIAAVVSNKPDAFGLQRAQSVGIPTHTINHKEFADREAFDSHMGKVIDQYQPDLIVLAGFMRILSSAFVNKYAGRMLNIHPSLLPKYQGLHTHQRALEAGDECHGVSVHFVTEELDGGPIVIQAIVPINNGDNTETLAQRVQQQEHIIYPLTVEWFAHKRLKLIDNEVLLDGESLPITGYQIDTRISS